MAQYGVQCDKVRLVGGGSHSALWRRIAADVFQKPLLFPVEADAPALGAALQVCCHQSVAQSRCSLT